MFGQYAIEARAGEARPPAERIRRRHCVVKPGFGLADSRRQSTRCSRRTVQELPFIGASLARAGRPPPHHALHYLAHTRKCTHTASQRARRRPASPPWWCCRPCAPASVRRYCMTSAEDSKHYDVVIYKSSSQMNQGDEQSMPPTYVGAEVVSGKRQPWLLRCRVG